MTIFSSELLAAPAVAVCLICCYYGLKKLGLKKFFPLFLIFTLSVSSFFLSPLRKGNSPEITAEYKAQIVNEQTNVAAWYTDYKKDLTQLDLLWQQYHKSLASFCNDEISIQTLLIRLLELEKNFDAYQAQYEKMPPPAPLRPETENVLTEIAAKTAESIRRQNAVVKNSIKAISSNTFKEKPHEKQAQILTKIMTLDSPGNLDIAGDISALRSLLTVPDEK